MVFLATLARAAIQGVEWNDEAQKCWKVSQPFTPPFQYFDTTKLECKSCAADEKPESQPFQGGPSIACSCEEDYSKNCASPPCSCEKCTSGKASSSNGALCLNFAGAECAATQRRVETSNDITCVECPAGKWSPFSPSQPAVKLFRSSCVSETCGEYLGQPEDTSSACVCTGTDSKRTDFGTDGQGTCIRTSVQTKIKQQTPGRNEFRINYFNVEEDAGSDPKPVEVESTLFSKFFWPAAAGCWDAQETPTASSKEACQALANMCVLDMYRDDTGSDASTKACSAYEKAKVFAGTGDPNADLPEIKFDGDSPISILTNKDIKMDFSFDMTKKGGTHDTLTFILNTYAINGTWLGFKKLTNDFLYCDVGGNDAPWLKFGYGFQKQYTCDLKSFLTESGEPRMYDIWLVDDEQAGGTDKLFPVPVRIINYGSGDDRPNANSHKDDESDDVLVRRFFLYDSVTSCETPECLERSYKGNDDPHKNAPKVLRYAKDITLSVMLQKGSDENIYPPVLEIEYVERLVEKITLKDDDSMRYASLSFKVEYVKDMDAFWRAATAIYSIAMVGVFFLWILRLNVHRRRNTRKYGDGEVGFASLVRASSYLMSTHAAVFFVILLVYSLYFIVFFKLQSHVYELVPPDRPQYGVYNDYYAFFVVLQLCFAGQLFRMLEILFEQTNVAIFFIDWERSRGHMTSGKRPKATPVSVWRTIFIANEWNELQTARKTNLELTLIVLIAILNGADFQYLATPQPNEGDLSPGVLNPVLRFGNVSFWFLLICFSQRLWKWAVHERFFAEPPHHQFVDLCTIAKVSCIVLDSTYHGYYLHCRSSGEHADGTMSEITKQLREEGDFESNSRGLDGAPAGMQTFEIHVSAQWKEKYDQVYGTLMQQEEMERQRQGGALGFVMKTGGAAKGTAPDTLLKASKNLNRFLIGFIGKDLPEFEYRFAENLFTHRYLRIPPEMHADQSASIFYEDPGYTFVSVILYGCEWDLMLFNILTFTTMNVWYGTIVAALITYIMDNVFVIVRGSFGQQNVATKTMVDDRFLV